LRVSGGARPLSARSPQRDRVRRVQPKVHASVVRRNPSAGRAGVLLSVPRRTLRLAHRRARRGSAAPAAATHRARYSRPGHLRHGRRGAYDMTTRAPRSFSRDQRITIIYGMLVFVLITVVLQLWLLTATMNAWLGGDDSVVWPAAAASLGCLALNVGLLLYLHRLEKAGRT